jgi:hypothetical protein
VQKNAEPLVEEKKLPDGEAKKQLPAPAISADQKEPLADSQTVLNADKQQVQTSVQAADQKEPLANAQGSGTLDGKAAPEKTPPKEAGLPAQEQPLQVEPLGSMDAELIRLRGFLARRNMLAADRLADALLRSGSESRILPLLGNVKFFMNKFAAAEQLWLQSLQANHLVTLELAHIHDESGDFCLGQLKFKKKIIMFSSDARGDHSFALQAGNIRSVSLGDDQRITILATINGQDMIESFRLGNKIKKSAKEQFLVDFLNKYVL